jgi:ArsR family transcriptional regulator
MAAASPSALLSLVAEPTRLRILNCLSAAPMFVSDLQAVLDLPQPTVSRHLQVLRRCEVVRDTPIAQFVLYRLRRDGSAEAKVVAAVLEAVATDAAMRTERAAAIARSRQTSATRTTAPRRAPAQSQT